MSSRAPTLVMTIPVHELEYHVACCMDLIKEICPSGGYGNPPQLMARQPGCARSVVYRPARDAGQIMQLIAEAPGITVERMTGDRYSVTYWDEDGHQSSAWAYTLGEAVCRAIVLRYRSKVDFYVLPQLYLDFRSQQNAQK